MFESVPASASLMRAIQVLRDANRSETSSLPKSAPTGFIKQRWAAQVMPGGAHRPALLRTLRVVFFARIGYALAMYGLRAADNTDPMKSA